MRRQKADVDHIKKASEAKSPHAEENDLESSTDGEFDGIIKA